MYDMCDVCSVQSCYLLFCQSCEMNENHGRGVVTMHYATKFANGIPDLKQSQRLLVQKSLEEQAITNDLELKAVGFENSVRRVYGVIVHVFL